MCGIAGIWGEPRDDRLRAMAAALRHRGPDDEGYWHSGDQSLGFAHRRLAIIDLEGGHQPITNEDGRIVTVYNGEIYNYRELRTDLISRGHVLKTKTDTEVIVHLYEDHGLDFVTKLRGMFAIALWDDRTRQLILTRDRVGKKPLYYSLQRDEFMFASELKGITAAATHSLDLNDQAIADFLAWGCVPAPATIYRDVFAVRPAEIVTVRERHVVDRRQYWELPRATARLLSSPTPEATEVVSKREALAQVDELLQEAVQLRLRADVPVGCFLSGGIDSGLITAMAARQYPGRLKTITAGFEDDAFDERPLARLIAERYGTDHHEIIIRPDVANDLPQIVRAYDQPFGDSSAIPSWYVSGAARALTKVVLNGDGGDELFGGYRRYLAARIAEWLSWLDGPEDRRFLRLLADYLPARKQYRSGATFLRRLLLGLSLEPASRYLAWTVDGFNAPTLGELSHDGRSGWIGRTAPPERLASAALAELGWCSGANQAMGADFRTVLPNDLLVKMDVATMGHGLEARSPFLDHRLVETFSNIPARLKGPGMKTKPLLRALGQLYLPRAILRAPKRGFEVPLLRWLQEDLRGIVEDVLFAGTGLIADRFNRQAIERLVRRAEPIDAHRWSRQVWFLLMLGLWDRVVWHERRPSLPPIPASVKAT